MSFENFARLVQKKMKEAKKNGMHSTKNQNLQKSTPKYGCCGKKKQS
jgi:hypothetical protein